MTLLGLTHDVTDRPVRGVHLAFGDEYLVFIVFDV